MTEVCKQVDATVQQKHVLQGGVCGMQCCPEPSFHWQREAHACWLGLCCKVSLHNTTTTSQNKLSNRSWVRFA